MAWTKAKVAIVTSACVVLAGAIAILCIYENRQPVEGIPKGWSVIHGDVDQWNWTGSKINGHTSKGESLLVSTKEYRDVVLSAVASTTNREASLALRMQDADNGYLVIFGPLGDVVVPGNTSHGNGFICLRRKTLGVETELGVYRGRIFTSLGPSAKITVRAKGPWLQVFLNDVNVIRVKDTTFSSGFIGLRIYGGEDYPCDATFSNLSFY